MWGSGTAGPGVRFKDRFYPSGSAHYELAKPGTMRLLPPEKCIPLLREDYEHMEEYDL